MITLHEGEEKILEVRRHLFVFYARMFWLTVLVLLPLIIFSIFRGYLEILLNGSEGMVFSALYLLWILILWMSFFYQWTDYYFDVWIVTNERIVDVEQVGFFSRKVSTLQLDRIQDITVRVDGMVATFLKFGDLHIQTAGDQPMFVIKQASQPLEVKEAILNQVKNSQNRSSGL